MRKIPLFACLLLLAGCGPKSRSLDLLEPNTFTAGIEGPATDANGFVYAVNYAEEGTIGRVGPDGDAELFLRLPEGSVGNGIAFDTLGNMFIADYVKHRVYRASAGSRTPEIWAEVPAMNQPNDLCIHPDGTLYLSDPNWAESTGNLWRILPNGTPELLESGMGTTNGIALSPDSRFLYVNESVQRAVWKYTLGTDGRPRNKTLFHRFTDFGMDGMRCDVQGNLYIARYDKGTVAVLGPDGQLLKEFHLTGKKPSNLTFAGPDSRTIYVTMADRGCFELIEAEYPGARITD